MIPLTDDELGGFRMRLNFRSPEKMVYDIAFVARTLGRIGRFNNISDKFYSVAEHSYHASYLYPSNPLGALMHDATECFTGDITTHLKAELQGIKEVERRIEADLVRRFGYETVGPDFKELVDRPLFYREERELFDDPHDVDGRVLRNLRLHCWPPDEAGNRFLRRFEELT